MEDKTTLDDIFRSQDISNVIAALSADKNSIKDLYLIYRTNDGLAHRYFVNLDIVALVGLVTMERELFLEYVRQLQKLSQGR